MEAVEFFREHGRKGGKKAAAKMTPEQRRARALKAVAAREAKRAKARKRRGNAGTSDPTRKG